MSLLVLAHSPLRFGLGTSMAQFSDSLPKSKATFTIRRMEDEACSGLARVFAFFEIEIALEFIWLLSHVLSNRGLRIAGYDH